MSSNPNAIAAADTFHLHLTSVMMAGIIPAIFGLILTYFLAKRLRNKGSRCFIPRGCRSRNTESTLIFDRTCGAFGCHLLTGTSSVSRY